MPHGSPRNTPTLRALMCGCSVRTFVSQPVLCCQQWREGVGLIHFYSPSCYSTLNTKPGKCLCQCCRRQLGRAIGSRPKARVQHRKNVETEQEWKRVSEEELGRAFYHRAIIHSLVNTDKRLSSNTLTVLHGHKQSWYKGSCSTSGTASLASFSSRNCHCISAKLEILHHRAVVLWQPKIPKQQD